MEKDGARELTKRARKKERMRGSEFEQQPYRHPDQADRDRKTETYRQTRKQTYIRIQYRTANRVTDR